MKLSDKYILKFHVKDGDSYHFGKDEIECYKEICGLEAQQTLLVSNESIVPQNKFIDKLAEIVNALQMIAEKENL